MAATATVSGARLFLEPLVDLDRTMDAPPGLLDRLCNPRTVFHVVRTLNTILFSEPQTWKPAAGSSIPDATTFVLESADARLLVMLPDDPERAAIRLSATDLRAAVADARPERVRVVHLETGTIRSLDPRALDSITVDGATVLLVERGRHRRVSCRTLDVAPRDA